MKILCDREKLREGLALANNVIPAKSPKPALSNVCLVATDGALELVGTDLEVAMRYRIEDVKVSEPGTAVIPARVALDFVRDLTGETVTLETNGSNCTISSGSDSCELVTIDPDEFPVVAHFDVDGGVSLQGGTFTALVGRTAFAAAREQGRYAMHGVLTEIADGQLKMVATDGRRLAVASAPIDAPKNVPRPVIVPTKGTQLFCRVITDPLDQIQLSFSENQIGLKTRNAEVFARLLDGEFPRYQAVIPTESANSVEADSETLLRKLRLVANVTGEEARAVRLSIKKGTLEIFGQSAGRGEARAAMEIDYKGKNAEIAFNPDYVIDGLKNCENGAVVLEFNEKTSPGKFRLGESYIYIVMPITIDT
jgi:DNA polymerase-3 subunit beta